MTSANGGRVRQDRYAAHMKRKQFQSPKRLRALAVLARMRSRGESLSQAASLELTTPRTVLKTLPKQFRRSSSGRYSVTRSDSLRRDLTVLGNDGYVPVAVRSWNQAQLASAHLVAVNRFLRTGDFEWLKPFIIAVTKAVGNIQIAFTAFAIAYPLLVATAFFIILWYRPYVFYSPTEFGSLSQP